MTIVYGYIFYYIAALFGHSIGYHRYFSHKSFTTNKWIEYVLLFCGLICGGRSPLMWCAVHRMHHHKSDTTEDPHSPVYKGKWNIILSRFKVPYVPRKYIKDLLKNPRVVFFHKHGRKIHFAYALIVLLFGLKAFFIFVIMPFVLAWLGFGFLNYFAHRNGKPETVLLLNLIAPGEAWHDEHHKNPKAIKLHKFDIAGNIIERFIIRKKFSS